MSWGKLPLFWLLSLSRLLSHFPAITKACKAKARPREAALTSLNAATSRPHSCDQRAVCPRCTLPVRCLYAACTLPVQLATTACTVIAMQTVRLTRHIHLPIHRELTDTSDASPPPSSGQAVIPLPPHPTSSTLPLPDPLFIASRH